MKKETIKNCLNLLIDSISEKEANELFKRFIGAI